MAEREAIITADCNIEFIVICIECIHTADIFLQGGKLEF